MDWFVVRSKTKQELNAKAYFDQLGVEAYVPYYLKRASNTAKAVKKKPAISGYVFFSLEKFNYAVVNTNPLVGDVLKNSQGIVKISQEEIDAMKNHLSSRYASDDFKNKAVGDTIELQHGVFSGKEGEIVVKEKNRLIINLKSIAMRLSIALN